MPDPFFHWLAILFGVLFYVLLLPLFYLAWNLPTPVIDDESGEAATKLEIGPRDVMMISGMGIGLTAGMLFFDDAILGMAMGTGAGYVVGLVRERLEKG